MRLPLLVAPLVAVTLAMGGCSIARQVMYAPRAEAVAIADWTNSPPQTLAVTTNDKLALQGFYWPGAPGDRDIFLFFHGRRAHQGVGAKYAQYLRGRGDAVLVASYRGFGSNPGSPSKEGMLRDAAAFVAKARELAGADARLWFVGHSLGAAVALEAACADGHAAGVITISAFADIREAAPAVISGILPDAWDNRAAARCVKAPMLILQGSADDIVPPTSAGELLPETGGPAEAISMTGWTHKPVMQTLGPWTAEAIGMLANGRLDTLPPLPADWTVQGTHRQ